MGFANLVRRALGKRLPPSSHLVAPGVALSRGSIRSQAARSVGPKAADCRRRRNRGARLNRRDFPAKTTTKIRKT